MTLRLKQGRICPKHLLSSIATPAHASLTSAVPYRETNRTHLTPAALGDGHMKSRDHESIWLALAAIFCAAAFVLLLVVVVEHAW